MLIERHCWYSLKRGFARSCADVIVVVACCMTVAGQSPLRTDDGAPVKRDEHQGLITGRVVQSNGIIVPFATIQASAVGPNAGSHFSGYSEEDGTFSLEVWGAGPFQLSATAPAYVSGSDQAPYLPGSNATLRLEKGGVITGRVSDRDGRPVIGARVRALAARPTGRKTPDADGSAHEHLTDDRGVYRIYGLPAGAYLVEAGAASHLGASADDAYASNVPTFYPSANRASALQVRIAVGDEASGIDIVYSGTPGRSVRGTLTLDASVLAPSSAPVRLIRALDSGLEREVTVPRVGDSYPFAILGVPDGEYLIVSKLEPQGAFPGAKIESRLIVHGADTDGIDATYRLMCMVRGAVVLGGGVAANCGDVARERLLKTKATVRSTSDRTGVFASKNFNISKGRPGTFAIAGLDSGSYSLTLALDDALFISAVSAKANVKVGTATGAFSGIVKLRSGDVAGPVEFVVENGAAGVSGTIRKPARSKRPVVLLVPIDAEYARTWVRYYSSAVAKDGHFAVKNVAPGRYWVVATDVGEAEHFEIFSLFDLSSSAAIEELRTKARTKGVRVELKPCDRLGNLEVIW